MDRANVPYFATYCTHIPELMNKVLPGEQNFSERGKLGRCKLLSQKDSREGGRGKCKAGDSIKVFSPFLQNSGVGPRVVRQSYLGEPMFVCELLFLHKFIGIFIRA